MPQSRPARTYDEALERARVFAELDDASILPAARTALLTHGRATPLAVVLLHGFTNNPAQYAKFAPLLHERGVNVFVPRMPEHGDRDRLTTRIASLTAQELVESAGEALDLACGLGDRVGVLGISMGATLAAYFAQYRPLAVAVPVAPDFALLQLPYAVSRAFAQIFLWLPNFFTWWDPRERERQRPLTAYPRLSTRALMETLRVGDDVYAASQHRRQLAERIVTVVNRCDPAVNNDAAQHVSSAWSGWRPAEVEYVELRHLPENHDIIDPENPSARTGLVYPRLLAALGVATAIGSAGCASAPSALPPGRAAATVATRAAAAGKIDHVIIVVQENRSFDNLFQGYPGADTVSRGRDSSGKSIRLHPVSLTRKYDIDHSAAAMFAACDTTGRIPGTKCRMDGFDREQSPGGPHRPQYAYVPRAESKPYFDMAREWVLADRMFQSQIDESFTSHQYIIAGQAQSSVNVPFLPEWGCNGGHRNFVQTIVAGRAFGPPQRPCFDYLTLGDELDAAHLTWRFYTSRIADPGDGVWSGYQAVRHIRFGPDWKNVVTPQKRFLSDVAAGTLENVTWITPTCEESDHPNCGGGLGPSWVTAIVDAVGTSKFWDSTAIFVMWDDWGGLYDHVPPPHLDDDGLGFRVPLLIVSAYAKRNYVSHVRYEHGSILRFAEDAFGLGRLAASDARANSPAEDCFDFAKPPRKFVPIRAPRDARFFLGRADDLRAPDSE